MRTTEYKSNILKEKKHFPNSFTFALLDKMDPRPLSQIFLHRTLLQKDVRSTNLKQLHHIV